jgi:hypothetical protein
MGFDYFPHDQFIRIVKAHGADKVLFASIRLGAARNRNGSSGRAAAYREGKKCILATTPKDISTCDPLNKQSA